MSLAVLFLLGVTASPPPVLSARFIGNSAFELSDGTATIFLDFPYQSGAFGYMTFPSAEVAPRTDALCLFTHRHADHFDPSIVPSLGCGVAGPAEVQSRVASSLRAGPGPVWHFHDARIECLSTPHASLEHCSYAISWHGIEIFVSGDIEDLEAIQASDRRFHALFVPSWLAPTVAGLDLTSYQQVVVHHHTANERPTDCARCLVPSQGRSFEILGAPPIPPLQPPPPR
jgi:L-ascorbate metabolism protein UlaG (beta-lactamase superfamily)